MEEKNKDYKTTETVPAFLLLKFFRNRTKLWEKTVLLKYSRNFNHSRFFIKYSVCMCIFWFNNVHQLGHLKAISRTQNIVSFIHSLSLIIDDKSRRFFCVCEF